MIIYYFIQFFVVLVVVYIFNGTYLLSYNSSDVYFTLTNLYIAIISSCNTLWVHQLIIYLVYKKLNIYLLFTGIILSIIFFYILRKQFYIKENHLLRRLIIKNSSTIYEISTYLKNNNIIDRYLEKNLNNIITNNLNNNIIYKKILNEN